ncbi:acyl-CoA thioester hydrolase/BAAT C-terminal domain-containing protein [Georgenia sp. 10Sc9-8]|uniref:Acyl-CoA thioester hydrolase/BAAT C-terminal domain-containing protein n=1 Tax=Georgenia halotolerans TaxID=3028317 RepID=A0ABT5TZH3_9MICO|nr:acyl-CoA thioester hydrolase/BAAT C-terminal domain-containing protein [Georgenia halotolerans]
MTYGRVAASIVLVLLLGLIGSLSGPGWNPEPLQQTLVPESPDTTIGSDVLTTPVGTYEVRSQVVDVAVDEDVEVRATVREPVGAVGDRPAVLFMHGAGTATHQNFADITTALSSAGIVTMVPDKRMDTYSTRYRDYHAMAEDYHDSVEVLRQHPSVDPDQVGVYGESEGAFVAPVTAAESDDVSFVILVSAPVVTPREQAAFAVDSYLSELGVPERVLRAIPRAVGAEIPGGGFEYADFDVSEYQQQLDDEPVLMVYGTDDASMPTVQGPQQLIEDLEEAGSNAYTIRYYADANHGIRVDGELAPSFPDDAARWVLGLPQTADAPPKVAGAEPEQRFRAEPVDHPRWYASGDMIVITVLVGLGLVALSVVLWLVGRLLRVVRARPRPLVPPLGRMTTGLVVATLATWALFIAYLMEVADLALNYRSDPVLVQGGWLAVQAVGVLAGALMVFSAAHAMQVLRARTPERPGVVAWSVYGSAHLGCLVLLVNAAYWGVFPAVL